MRISGGQPRSDKQAPAVSPRNVLCAIGLVLGLVSGLGLAVSLMPPAKGEVMDLLREFPPRTLPALLAQRDALLAYAVAAPSATLAAFSLLYILMQTLAIPGTLALSVLAGALYGHWIGWVLVSGISTVGAWTCYQLSYLIGRPLAAWAWPERLGVFASEVSARRGQLTLYVILLRATPVLPNIFINIASPVVGVPVLPFVTGTLLGCMPNNFVAVGTGTRLSSMRNMTDLYDRRSLFLGLGVAVVAVLPVWLQRGSRGLGPAARRPEDRVPTQAATPKAETPD